MRKTVFLLVILTFFSINITYSYQIKCKPKLRVPLIAVANDEGLDEAINKVAAWIEKNAKRGWVRLEGRKKRMVVYGVEIDDDISPYLEKVVNRIYEKKGSKWDIEIRWNGDRKEVIRQVLVMETSYDDAGLYLSVLRGDNAAKETKWSL